MTARDGRMEGPQPTRRRFLEGLAAMGLSAPLLAGCASTGETSERRRGAVEGDYDLDPSITYLNHASIGTVPRTVTRSRARNLEACESNPWLHVWGGYWDEVLTAVRERAAAFLGCGDDELAFVRNTTEAFNMLAAGLPLGPGDEVLFSSLNHSGASECFRERASERGYRVRTFDFPAAELPEIDEDAVVEAYVVSIRDRTRLLVMPHIDNIYGIRHPLARIARLARERGVEWIAVDGAQSVGMIPVDVPGTGVDFYATSGHKWTQSPKGIGLLYLNRAHVDRVRPLFVTWGQKSWRGTARGLEDFGTRDPSLQIALGEAIAFQQAIDPNVRETHYRELRDHLYARVDASPKLRWRSPRAFEAGGSLVAIEVAGVRSQDVFRKLWERDRIVFRAMRSHDLETIRISPNLGSSRADLDRLIDRVEAFG